MNVKQMILPGALVLTGVATGLIINANSANAATTSTTSTGTPGTSQRTATDARQNGQPPVRDESKSGHVGSNGVTEELLTGEIAAKAKAAAEAAVSDGTILRVETDAEGAAYEAHVRKTDGTQVTVKMDSNCNVTSIEDGPGAPPSGNRQQTADDTSI